MPKPLAPQIETFQRRDIEQIGNLQAEIKSLRELERRKAISKAEADREVKQRERAQVLLCQKGATGTSMPVVSEEEKVAALEKVHAMIGVLSEKRTELQNEHYESELAGTAAGTSKLERVDADLAILTKAKEMLESGHD